MGGALEEALACADALCVALGGGAVVAEALVVGAVELGVSPPQATTRMAVERAAERPLTQRKQALRMRVTYRT